MTTALLASKVSRLEEEVKSLRVGHQLDQTPCLVPALPPRNSTPLHSLLLSGADASGSLPLHHSTLSLPCLPVPATSATPSVPAAQGRANLKRIELPVFSGAVEDYWEFRQCFHTLVADSYTDHPLYLMQLKNHLRGEAKDMLRGITTVEEAWSVLDQHFGDHNAAIATITTRLRHLKVSVTAPH